jgi:hypothetical protein
MAEAFYPVEQFYIRTIPHLTEKYPVMPNRRKEGDSRDTIQG